MNSSNSAILLLEDGTYFTGTAIGKKGTTFGEITFNTGMTGYQEVFTDPSYYGQISVMTTAHIGNYGSHPNENESEKIMIAGLVTKKFSKTYSRTSANESINDKMIASECVGIADVDTRALVRYVRHKGAMNAAISSEILDVEELKKLLEKVPSMEGLELSSKVTTKEKFTVKAENSQFKVALIDFGVKQNIIRCLNDRGCDVTVFPMNTTLDEIKAMNPDGIMLSNGPGDPAAMIQPLELVQQLKTLNLPIFGICMGHQLLGLSYNLKTVKMQNGHRGINHPVVNFVTGKCEVTSQNHGFVISDESVQNNQEIEVTHRHLNDNTVAGISVKNKPIFSVQYHPEASAGPHDSRYLFDQFIENMKSKVN